MHKIRLLTLLLAAGLSLILVQIYWHPGLLAAVTASGIIFLAAGGAVFYWRRRTPQDSGAIINESLLPPERFAGWVVLVCGGEASLFAAGEPYRETQQGWYIAVAEPENLSQMALYLVEKRPTLSGRLALLLAIIPEEQQTEAFTHGLRSWHRAIAACKLPVTPLLLACSWLSPPGDNPSEALHGWFTLLPEQGMQFHPLAESPLSLSAWQQEALAVERESRLHRLLWLDSLLKWEKAQVAAITGQHSGAVPALKFCARGWNFTPPGALENNLWQQHLASQTSLSCPGVAWATLPLPDCLLAQLPRRQGTGIRQILRTTGLLCGVFLLLAMLASWHHNRQLLLHVNHRLALYLSLPEEPPEPKLQARAKLKDDLQLLESWRRGGEPLRYGLGLYKGAGLIAPVRAAIEAWPPLVVAVQQPQTIRLDSLALFASGQWRLKADSTRVLVNALIDIKAKPGWLIEIAGHTDNVGSVNTNQHLSLKRAEAVRDWMRDNGGIAESCFVVQGYSASRPLKSNDTEAGRMANRRVEISLSPQAGACPLSAGSVPPQGGDVALNQMATMATSWRQQ